MKVFSRLRSWLFALLLIVLAVSYFSRARYKSVNDIHPHALAAPVQTRVIDQSPMTFSRDGYDYTLTPLYDYTLTGLVLHAQQYNRWFSLSRTDKTFTKDVCVVWGKTVEHKGYQDNRLSVEQDLRFCFVNFFGNPGFDFTEFSNNHLIAGTQQAEKQIQSIHGGDQIKITGRLVNVKAVANGPIGTYEHRALEWKTSTTRDDSGAGACEIVLVESVEMLQKGNALSHFLFSLSLYGLGGLGLWSIGEMILERVAGSCGATF